MSDAAHRMVVAIRRELIAFALAGVAIHWILKQGFTRWAMAALGISLGIGVTAARGKRKTIRDRKPPQE